MNSHFELKLFSIVFICIFTLGKLDPTSEKAALNVLRPQIGRKTINLQPNTNTTTNHGKTLVWDDSKPTPCNWDGVTCDTNNNSVTKLALPAVGLHGNIPDGVFGNLTGLVRLSLRSNKLTGQLPSDLARCTKLRSLYLQNNSFSGEIPSFLFELRNLQILDLSRNMFSGKISPAFNNLNRLITLYLEANQLSGSIPELNLPRLVRFNVSYNKLNGYIPSKLGSMNSTAFEGNSSTAVESNSLCGEPLELCPGEKNSTDGSVGEKNKKKLSGGAIAGIAIGLVIAFLLIVLIIYFLCRKKSSRKTLGSGYSGAAAAAITATSVPSTEADIGNEKLLFFRNPSRFFDLENLLSASIVDLGEGTFGTAYKADLVVGTTVAVKSLKDVAIPEKEFMEKIEIVGSMDHENLVPLVAYYYSVDEKRLLLVYDYMTSGSLSALLHGNKGLGKTPLNWEVRSGIALGAARGIEYLHSRGPNISHGNIKSSNILLTKNYDANVSHFGLAQLVGPTSTPNYVAGYRAPEVTDVRKVSQKGDVYSFGVLLLELLTGKAPTHTILNEEGVDLLRWVQSIVREEWTAKVFDLELLRYQNTEEEMVQLLQLAIDCVAQYPDKRPTMTKVIRRIEEICHSIIRQLQDPLPDVIVNPNDS